MDRWFGKVAVVTGASSGIGAAIVEELVNAGLKVIGLARRVENVQQQAAKLAKAKGKLYPIRCDVSKEEEIVKAFAWTEQELGGVDVLINNAGVLFNEPILASSAENMRKILDVNVVAVALCAREAVKSMRKRKSLGHIININSVAGHYAEVVKMPISVYPASKYAVTALTLGLRHELTAEKLPIKITSLSPGPVKTEMLSNLGLPENVLENMPILVDKDIAHAVTSVLGTPPNVQIYEHMVMPLDGLAQGDSSAWTEVKK